LDEEERVKMPVWVSKMVLAQHLGTVCLFAEAAAF